MAVTQIIISRRRLRRYRTKNAWKLEWKKEKPWMTVNVARNLIVIWTESIRMERERYVEQLLLSRDDGFTLNKHVLSWIVS